MEIRLGIISWIVVGLIAGILAGKMREGGYGLVGDLVAVRLLGSGRRRRILQKNSVDAGLPNKTSQEKLDCHRVIRA